MGFTTGFTGGVTLVLGTTYLALRAHQLHRERQADALRSQTFILTQLSARSPTDPFHSHFHGPSGIAQQQQQQTASSHETSQDENQQLASLSLPLRPSERAALARQSFIDEAKHKWNSEVEGAVKWAQEKDWVAAREDVETVVGKLWRRVSGDEVTTATVEKLAEVKDQVVQNTFAARDQALTRGFEMQDRAQVKAGEVMGKVQEVVSDGVQSTKVKSREVLDVTREKAQHARDVSQTRAKVISAEAKQESKEVVTSIWERGLSAGRSVASTAKAAAGAVSDAVSGATTAAGAGAGAGVGVLAGKATGSDVERALQERYEKPDESVLNKSVEQVLQERYLPVDKQDHSHLRGL